MATPKLPGDWRKKLAFPGIVASCRIRLARNLTRETFPDHASPEDRERVRNAVCEALRTTRPLRDGTVIPIETASAEALLELREEHLISSELTERGSGGALLLNANRTLSVMVNEEDHLRIQVLRPDADLAAAWRTAEAADTAFEERLEYAFHPAYGYLTACPTNVGTGLRVSVMLHLLGLRLTEEIDPVFKALDRLGIAVRGIWGEGSEAAGHLYQLSNQQSLGETEVEIIARLGDVARETARQEQNARLRLVEGKPEVMLDCLARALAILRNARILHSDETLDFLCALRMGLDAGLVTGIEPAVLDYWTTAILPGHMQGMAKGVLEPEARDRIRAELMRRALENVALA